MQVRRIERFQPHRHRSLDPLVLARRLADRTLSPIVLFQPDPLSGWGLGAPTAQAFLAVTPMLVEVFGIRLRRYPVAPRGARLTRLALCRPQEIPVDQVGSRRQHAIRLAHGLRCNPLAWWGDGWCAHGSSRRSGPLNAMPGIAGPPGGPVGLTSPPSSVLGVATTASLPISGRFALARFPIPGLLPSCGVSLTGSCAGGSPRPRRGLGSPGPPVRA